ncbi:hypothetical protein ABZ816_18865 [Actinosynnema sp. NPDC047251]|uniref:Uncharacterized protein n=1 Tax=Saccharothrix espanaensis (strain ATCC 51144 / DSM 44229 / JCM 9112 / NBRC 15066 / NRRL 15764) TaxID=1179773 RepID=K0K9I0_SACES|nr:hypothetical protein [Saccharothrix espanaensis]CCH33278.1 hypothetical protein BN6_60220 [Saccharothrix espanaensis DSM 44229]
MQPEVPCELCDDSGTMSWVQPVQKPDGTFVLIDARHPCTCERSRWWRAPAAERSRVVEVGERPEEIGNVAEANRPHRTDWSRPREG